MVSVFVLSSKPSLFTATTSPVLALSPCKRASCAYRADDASKNVAPIDRVSRFIMKCSFIIGHLMPSNLASSNGGVGSLLRDLFVEAACLEPNGYGLAALIVPVPAVEAIEGR